MNYNMSEYVRITCMIYIEHFYVLFNNFNLSDSNYNIPNHTFPFAYLPYLTILYHFTNVKEQINYIF